MPRLCSFGCRPEGETMHCFPNPDKELNRFRLWVSLVGGKLETASDYEYYRKKKVCDKHFTDNDRNRYRRLNSLAVPSLLLTGVPSGLTPSRINEMAIDNIPMPATCSTQTLNFNLGDHNNITPSRMDVIAINNSTMPETSSTQTLNLDHGDLSGLTPSRINEMAIDNNTSLNRTDNNFLAVPPVKRSFLELPCMLDVMTEHNYSVFTKPKKKFSLDGATPKLPLYNCAQLKPYKTKIKYLQSEICRLRKKGQSLKSRLTNAQKLSNDIKFQRVISTMTRPAQLFVNMQKQNVKKPKGRRFSVDEKILCLSLFKKSPKCYRLLYKYFALPSSKAMRRLLCQVVVNSGINKKVFEKIKKTVEQIPEKSNRLVSLIFDEMSLTPNVAFNVHTDKVEGLVDKSTPLHFTDHALVFMIKGIKASYKQPIAYFFTNCLNKTELTSYIKLIVKNINNTGLTILNTVCDQSTVNVGAINNLINEAKVTYMRQDKEWRHDLIYVNGQSIVPLYDAPHLIKGIRNNLITKNMSYNIDGKEKIVKWEYFQKVYGADKSYGELRLLDKITEEHIDPDKINKMKVKSATQIFSHSVAVVTEHLTARGDLPEECRDLIDITLLLDKVFDSLNISTLHIPNGKIFKGPIRMQSPHHQLWLKAKKILKTVKFIQAKQTAGNKIRLVETTVPSIINLIKTIEGMEAIWKELHEKYSFDAMLTRNFNQDPIENFFGNIRSYGVRNVSPNSLGFESAFKALLLNNYSTPHSKRANCEEDINECLQDLKFFIEDKKQTNLPRDSNSIEDVNDNNIYFEPELLAEDHSTSDSGQRNYVCGWVLRRCLQNIVKSCQHCRATIVDHGSNTNSDYTRRKEYSNRNWMCYPSQVLENCFHDLQNVTISFLKSSAPKINVKKCIKQLAEVFITEFPFHCKIHGTALKEYFINTTLNVLIHSWCRSINRILSGKIKYNGDDKIKMAAQTYYDKRKHYKNRK